MAMHASRVTRDQNFSLHFDGDNKSIVQKNKRGGLGGRKALNDISNSAKPSALQPSKKHNTKNVIPIGEDLSVLKKSKPQVSGRKVLGDLTNIRQQNLKTRGKQSIINVAEDENFPFSIAEEGFLHNHDECIKSQRKLMEMDMDEFFKTLGLHEEDPGCKSVSEFSPAPQKTKDRRYDGPRSPVCGSRIFPRLPCMDYDFLPEDLYLQEGSHSPLSPALRGSVCGSPISPWLPCIDDYDDNLFPLSQSPISN